jgi:hypothetical protein
VVALFGFSIRSENPRVGGSIPSLANVKSMSYGQHWSEAPLWTMYGLLRGFDSTAA